jgi:hypothetical protein
MEQLGDCMLYRTNAGASRTEPKEGRKGCTSSAGCKLQRQATHLSLIYLYYWIGAPYPRLGPTSCL